MTHLALVIFRSTFYSLHQLLLLLAVEVVVASGVVFVVFVVGDSGVGDGVVIIHGSSSL